MNKSKTVLMGFTGLILLMMAACPPVQKRVKSSEAPQAIEDITVIDSDRTEIVPLPPTVIEEQGLSLAEVISEVAVEPDGERLKVVMTGDGKLSPNVFMVGKDRLVVDFADVRSTMTLDTVQIRHALVKRIRIGQHINPQKVRVVLDLVVPITYNVHIDNHQVILVMQQVHLPLTSSELTMGMPAIKWSNAIVPFKQAGVVPVQAQGPPSEMLSIVESKQPSQKQLITLDFNNVDLVVFIRFVSEITRKNFIIDERVRGKVTIFSPAKISVDKVYEIFLSVMDLKGLAVVPLEEAIQILPATEVLPERDIFIYFLEHANAEETAKLLAGVVVQTARPARRPAPARRRTAVSAVSKDFEGQIQITPDKMINALIIRATLQDYEKLKKIIKQLDTKRHQVFVEAVIMEVSQDALRELGTELGVVAGYVDPGKTLSVIGGFNQPPEDLLAITNIPGIELSTIPTVNIRAAIKALETRTDANVISTPQILTTHNQKARIVVGQNVPFLTGSTTTTGGVIQQTIQRQDVGVTLELTPRVMEGDRIQLDIRQEISSVIETSADLGPTTKKREAMTSVIVENHQTVVIGGLMRDDVTTVERKIPFLGDIPLIGWLFKFKSKKLEKTNLLIFLTPHILQDAEDLEELRQQKSKDMRKAILDLDEKNRRSPEEFLDAINHPVSIPRR